jgi:hypothetical protein
MLWLPALVEARFVVTGSAADKATWNQMLQQCSNASPSFKALVDKINASTTKTVTIKLVRNVRQVVVDQFPNGTRFSNMVDLTDIEDFAGLDPPKVVDRCQVIAHILEERWQHACGQPYWRAHRAAIDAENDWRRDRGYTDRISKARQPGGVVGHGSSPDLKRMCHFWTDGDTTYDPIPGERTETTVAATRVSPGVVSIQISPQPNQDVTDLPQALGGLQVVLSGLEATMTLEIGPPIQEGEFMYAELTILDFTGTAPEASLPIPPFTTGPNRFALDPSQEQRGILNLDNGQVWLSYFGGISNDLFPEGEPLGTYSALTAVIDPADLVIEDGVVDLGPKGATFEVHTVAALLDGEPVTPWPHYPNTDCDGNGVQDYLDIFNDDTLDDGSLCEVGGANHYLDACDCLDCNGNGIADVVDIESGAELDCDWNGIPDSCEEAGEPPTCGAEEVPVGTQKAIDLARKDEGGGPPLAPNGRADSPRH